MKNKMLFFAAICFGFISISSVRADTVRLIYDQAHGEEPPRGPMDAIAKKLGLEIQASARPTSDVFADLLRAQRPITALAPPSPPQ